MKARSASAYSAAQERDGRPLGEEVYADGNKVGCNPPAIPAHKKSMAIMRVTWPAKQGAKLEVRGKNLKAKAIAHTISFDDPEKKKRNVVG